MNKKQWYLLAVGSFAIGMLLANISMEYGKFCDIWDEGEVKTSDLVACIRQHAFAPFPYILFGFGTLFIICASLESSNKKDLKS